MVLILPACNLPLGGSTDDYGSRPTKASADETETSSERQINSIDQEGLLIPTGGSEPVSKGHDNEESGISDLKTIYNGRLEITFERPFTSSAMIYLPEVDIKDFSMTKDDDYHYVQIALTGVNSNSNTLSGYYGVELDLNMDGRSDLLIFTQSALSSDWSREGVLSSTQMVMSGVGVVRADPNRKWTMK
jgi:hypothetical protein